MDDKVRIFTRNPLIPIAVIVLGSVWFALSIFSFFFGLLIPWAILRMPPTVGRQRRRNNAATPPMPALSVTAVSEPLTSTSGKSPIKHHVTFPDAPTDVKPRSRAAKRWSSPAGLPLDAAASKYRESAYAIILDSQSTLVDEPSSRRFSPELPNIDSPAASADAKGDSSFPEIFGLCSRRSSVSSSNRKLPLAARFTGMRVFGSRSVKRGNQSLSRSGSVASSCSSTPRSLTPPPSPPRKDDEPKVDRGEGSSRGEAFRSAIAAPFKFRPKRASASATMSTEYAEKVTFYAEPATVEAPASEPSTQTPSPPPSPTDEIPSSSAATPTPRSRRKPFTAYLNLALSTEVAASLTSPRRRGSVSSSSTSNSNSTQPRILSILSPTTPSSFKSPRTPKTPVPVQRTQPYGAPFFAPMPTGEYAYDERYRREFAKRRSSQRKVSGSASDVPRSAGVRRDSRDGDDEKGHSPGTAKPSNVPGVSFEQAQAQVVSRRRRSSAHRRNVSDGVMTS